MSESNTLVVVGQCKAIIEKPSGWTEFEIVVPGKQYPVKLATRKTELITAVRSLGDAIATWTYNESESDRINERSGKPYINRYLEEVEGGATTAGGNAVSPEAHHDPVHFADKDRLITRQTCLKAASSHPGGGEDWTADVIEAAARFETWLYRDIDDVPF